jgi:hypothetical protein
MFVIHSRSPSPIPELINTKKRKAEYDLYNKEQEQEQDKEHIKKLSNKII